MKTVHIENAPGAFAMALAMLRAGAKSVQAVQSLPRVTCVREQVKLEREPVQAYARICGFQEIHGVPLSYPQLLTFPLVTAFLSSGDCPWPAMGTVHLANRIAQHQRLNIGDVLRVEMCTGELMAHDKGQVFTLELRVLRDQQAVWEGTQTLLRLGVKDPVGPAYASRLDADIPLSRQADWRAPADIGRRYGRVSGDINPIHLSMLSARLFGFRRAIAHGLWTQARALAALMPDAPLTQAELDAEFKTPLFLPARASLWTRHSPDSKGHEVSFEVRNERGDKPHLRGRFAHATTSGTAA